MEMMHDLLLPEKALTCFIMAVVAVCDIIKTSEIAYHVRQPISATKSTSLNLYVFFSAGVLKNLQSNLLWQVVAVSRNLDEVSMSRLSSFSQKLKLVSGWGCQRRALLKHKGQTRYVSCRKNEKTLVWAALCRRSWAWRDFTEMSQPRLYDWRWACGDIKALLSRPSFHSSHTTLDSRCNQILHSRIYVLSLFSKSSV